MAELNKWSVAFKEELTTSMKMLQDFQKIALRTFSETTKAEKSLAEQTNKLTKALVAQSKVLKTYNQSTDEGRRKIEQSEIAITNQGKALLAMKKQLEALGKENKKLSNELINSRKAFKAGGDAVKEHTKNVDLNGKSISALETRYKLANKAFKETEKTINGRLNPAYTAARNKAAALKKEVALNTKEQGRNARAINEAATSVKSMSVKLARLTDRWDSLTESERKNMKVGGKLTNRINSLRGKIDEARNSTGRFQANVGNYSSALEGLSSGGIQGAIQGFGGLSAAAGIAVTALVAAGAAVAKSVMVYSKFEHALANVKAISKVTSTQLKVLENEALRLGQSTKFTATEVALLQVELSKLGLNVDEINDSTEAILNLSTATGEDLAESGKIATAITKGFGLSAMHTTRVVDVMQESFSSSALDLEKFSEAAKESIPFFRGAGVSVEGMGAALSVLADNLISGTRAGTANKNIMLELQNANSKAAKAIGFTVTDTKSYIKALRVLKAQGTGTTRAVELFGKVAGGSAKILIDNVDKVNMLTEAYNNAGGAAKEAADIMKDTLQGSFDSLLSASEGLMIQLGKTFAPATRVTVDALTSSVRFLSEAMQSTQDVTSKLEKEKFDKIFEGIDIKNAEEVSAKILETTNRITELEEASAKMVGIGAGSMSEDIKIIGDRNNELAESKRLLEKLKKLQEKPTNIDGVLGGAGSTASKSIKAAAGSLKDLRDQLSKAKKATEEFTEAEREMAGIATFAEIDALNVKIKEIEDSFKRASKAAKEVSHEAQFIAPEIGSLETESFEKAERADKTKTEDAQSEAEQRAKIREMELQLMLETASVVDSIYSRQIEKLRERSEAVDEAAARDILTMKTRVKDEETVRTEEARILLAAERKKDTIEREAYRKRLKQFRFNKALSIAEIAINTARAIMQVWGDQKLEYYTKVVSTVLLGGIGAAQSAKVAMEAPPAPPQYKDGRKGYKANFAEFAVVNEAGRELARDKSTGAMSWLGSGRGGAEYVHLKAGQEVIPHEESKRIVADRTHAVNKASATKTTAKNESFNYDRMSAGFKDAIDSQPVHTSTFEDGEVRQFVETSNTRTRTRNKNRNRY